MNMDISIIKVFSRLIAVNYKFKPVMFLEAMHSFNVVDLCIILNINRNKYYYLKRTNKLDYMILQWQKDLLESEDTK